jgi:AraC family transcriptional regulator of adaptative response / DNA-3-methyladenine glycosylase II
METLDPNICRQARLSRDRRFDGEFFLAVTSTGIYCRPICPARPPREDNVRYYRTAAEAAQQGFRPCLRCRPESAPLSPAWRGTGTTVSRALQLINEGYLNTHTLSQLADRVGVGERYLRKLFLQQLGVAPTTVAQTQRLHFAQKLLLETALPVTDIAFASGFGSVRRFNSATRDTFGCAPGELRRRGRGVGAAVGIQLELSYRPPYYWPGMLAFFARHAVTGVERVVDNSYERNLRTADGCARVRIAPHAKKPALVLTLDMSNPRELMPVVATVRRMFDLDAQPLDIESALTGDALLRPLLDQWPGLRSPVVPSVFESCVRAVLGQQISTEAARQLCARLVDASDSYAEVGEQRLALFPLPRQLARVPDVLLPMPGSRRRTLRAVCEYFAEQPAGDMPAVLADLAAIPGIGPWTLAMVGMRGFGDPDSFPATDLGIVNAARALADLDKVALRNRSAHWKPWRSYAANLFWRTLSP